MIQRVRIKNFKAIRDSKIVKLSPFTTFIGNNGSGKSSLVEALLLVHEAVVMGLSDAFARWGGLERIRHYQASTTKPKSHKAFSRNYEPIEIEIWGNIKKKKYHYLVHFTTSLNGDIYLVEKELLQINKKPVISTTLLNDNGEAITSLYDAESESSHFHVADGLFMAENSLLSPPDALIFRKYIEDWQFLFLNPSLMGFPQPQHRLAQSVRLAFDGRNVAEFVRKLGRDRDLYEAFLSKMKFVLPYASDIQTRTSDDFDKKVELLMYENGGSESVPGWLFSSGSLRILAILAVLSSGELPSVFFVDEIENGLDPRTIGLLINEIRQNTLSRSLQIVATTHSPYFLDLIPLDGIVVTEKDGLSTTFTQPDNTENLAIWKERFSPGKLYTMGKLTR